MQYRSYRSDQGGFCHQNCYATKTLFETVNGTANDTIAAIRNAEYLALVGNQVPLTIYAGWRIYEDQEASLIYDIATPGHPRL